MTVEKVNYKVLDTETGLEATVIEHCKANKEDSYLVSLKKTSDKGINCNQYFDETRFNKRFKCITK